MKKNSNADLVYKKHYLFMSMLKTVVLQNSFVETTFLKPFE